MTFVQVIDCTTHRVQELNRLMDDWASLTQGKRTATHAIAGRDLDDPTHVLEIVEFPTYEEAMRNSRLPETDRIYQEMVELCDAPPRFTNLDVFRDDQLNASTARRYLEILGSDDPHALDAVDDLVTPDYRVHDPANTVDPLDLSGFKDEVTMYVNAIRPSFVIEDQIAEGDRVTTRWTLTGTHAGEFQGLEPTGRRITLTGHVTHRFREGRIAESYWNWDNYGLLEQLGLIAV